MAFRMDDYQCQDCDKTTELLVDTNKSLEEQELTCQCGSSKLTKTISAGTGNKQHFSWASWRVNV